MIAATKSAQLERALAEEDPHLIAEALEADLAYDVLSKKEDRCYLVYEYRANLRIRKEQVIAIKSMLENKDVVQQMKMGGGKTTVLTSILLEMVDSGKIPLFIPPDAQFETQIANLTEMQHKYFYKQIIPFSFKRSELTVDMLTWMKKKIMDAILYKETIVATSTTLESLQLEWISLLDKQPSKISLEEKSKIPLLTEILLALRKNGVALLDEIDQILDPFKEVNFPLGEKELISPRYVDFIEKVFHYHLDPEVEKSLGILKNAQSSFPVNEYQEVILPKIAGKLFDDAQTFLLLDGSFKSAFISYVTKGEENETFRALLQQRMQSKNLNEKHSAEFVFLAKGIFFHLLPSVITKTENKNYGIPKGNEIRKVVPFLGVDSPAHTEFAGPYETACYHYLAALSNPITELQLETFASALLKKTWFKLEHERVLLEETEEFKAFFKATNVSLERFQNKDKTAAIEAVAYLKNEPKKRLELESLFIKEQVGFHPSYYSSNPQSFFDLFSVVKGFSGTPWNNLTYPEPLRKNINFEKGTEGKIRSIFLERVEEGHSKVHLTKTDDVSQVLRSALENNPRKDRFRALLDPCGRFKDELNESVAHEILTFFENDPKIKAVLFFGRVNGNMGVPGTLMALKKPKSLDGKFSLEVIGGTQGGLLEAKGISPESTITYYDERHCEATDIPQIPNALGLLTVNSKLLDRDFLQADLRLRGYLKLQDIDILLHEDECKNYPKELTGAEILTQMVVAQAIQAANEGVFAFKQKVDNIVRQKAVEALLNNPTHAKMLALREALVVKKTLIPSALFGKVTELKPPLDVFDAHIKGKEKEFVKIKLTFFETIYSFFLYIGRFFFKRDKDKAEAGQGFVSLAKEFRENLDSFPSSIIASSSSETFGMQMEMAVEQEITIEVNKEVELEYQRYEENYIGYYPFKEVSWPKGKPIIAEGNFRGPAIMSLSTLLQSDEIFYHKSYHKLFSKFDLLVSENFAYTTTSLLPVFSKKQKKAEQILVTEDDLGMKAALISAEEGAFFKKQIEEGLQKTWLYLPDGHMHVEPAHGRLPEDKNKLEKILFEANLFNGNVNYLLEHDKEILTILDKKLLVHFLALKAKTNPGQETFLEKLKIKLKVLDQDL